MATWWNRRGVTRVPATLVWVEFSESFPSTFPGLLPDTPAPSGLWMVVASYLVELAGPCGKACIMGPQAMVSLGSLLKCIFLEQKERASWDDILAHGWGWRVLIWNQIGVGCDSVIHKPCGMGCISFPLSKPWVSDSIKLKEWYFTMMLWVDNKIISIKPVVKCPEDKSHLIHCVLTCTAPLCPKEATELLFIWSYVKLWPAPFPHKHCSKHIAIINNTENT